MPKTILLVDDDQDIVEILQYTLTDAGFRVIYSDGSDTVAQAQLQQPALILLDHRLEDNWGGDICRQLKNSPITSAIPVIMISAAMRLATTAENAGADYYLEKPFDLEGLIALINMALEGPPQGVA